MPPATATLERPRRAAGPVMARARRAAGSPAVRQSSALLAGRGTATVLSGVWLAVAAHFLAVADFGRLALLIALHAVFFLFADPGVSVLLAHHVAERGTIEPDAVRRALWSRFTGAVVAVAAIVTTYHLTSGDRGLVVPLVFAGSVIGNAVHTTFTAALRSVGQVTAEALNEPLSRLAVVTGGTAWLVSGGGLPAAAATYAIADLLSCLALAPVILRSMRPMRPARPMRPGGAVAGDTHVGGTHLDLRLRRALPVAAGAGLGTVYYRLDTWLVSALAGAQSTARYAVGWKALDAVLLPATVVGAVALSRLPAVSAGRRGAAARRFAAGAAAAAAGVASVLFVAAGPVLRIGFGASYGAAAGTFRVLLVSALPGAVVAALLPTAAVHGRGRFVVVIAAATAINVAANLVLIPLLGVQGAAWANVVSQVLLAGWLVRIMSMPQPPGRRNT